MIKIISQDFNQKKWNGLAVHPLQSWQWGKARQQMGIEVLRIGEYKKKEIVNVYQLTFHKLPFIDYKIGYLPRSVFPTKEVLNFLTEYGKKHNIIFIKIEPYEESSRFKTEYSKLQMKTQNLIHSKHPLFPKWTQIIDLKETEEEMLKNMHYKTRYNIRLAQKKGVVVKEMSNEEGFKIFANLYFETCKRQKYFGHNYQYHKIVWQNLKNDIAHILVAFYQNIPLAAFEIFSFKDVVYYPYGGTSQRYRNFMASNLLMWKAIIFGKSLKAKKFDMWGSLPPDYQPNHPWAGFTRFKQGYAGCFTQLIGSFDLIINPVLYKLYGLSKLLRDQYLNIKRRLI